MDCYTLFWLKKLQNVLVSVTFRYLFQVLSHFQNIVLM